MDTPTAGVSLPFTAWEQAVFVALFVVLVLALLAWFSRQQGQWQNFIQERDEQWQKFLTNQRESDNAKSEAMTESLNALTAATQALIVEVQGQRSDFQTHDKKEWARLDEMSASLHTGERKTQPRNRNSG
jgi:uncharacterized membrane protein YhiD involved in acid resistance